MVCPATGVLAHGEQHAVANDCWDELFEEEHQEDKADYGESKIMRLEQTVQLHGLPIAHDLATAENDDVVRNQHSQGRKPC